MAFALDDKWLWDSWYVQDGETWHGYFLQADKSIGDPEERHWNVSYHHATSRDLTNWTSLGTCFAPAGGPAWDDGTTWTGSVLRGPDALWHLFYTGTSHGDGRKKQRLGHAISTDLHNWDRVGDGLILDIAEPYEEYDPDRWHDRAFRDPWVIRDPQGEGWLMYFTAREAGVADTRGAGCIGFATSPDLYTWTLQPPVFTGYFGELEVPQVFEREGAWYCLFCTGIAHWSDQAKSEIGPAMTGTHYLIGEGPRGPWRMAKRPFLDGAFFPKRYAARIVDHDGQLNLLGFNWFAHDGGPFIGAISDPDPVKITETGQLVLASREGPHG